MTLAFGVLFQPCIMARMCLPILRGKLSLIDHAQAETKTHTSCKSPYTPSFTNTSKPGWMLLQVNARPLFQACRPPSRLHPGKWHTCHSVPMFFHSFLGFVTANPFLPRFQDREVMVQIMDQFPWPPIPTSFCLAFLGYECWKTKYSVFLVIWSEVAMGHSSGKKDGAEAGRISFP